MTIETEASRSEELLAAVTRVENTVKDLQNGLARKSLEDDARFEKLEKGMHDNTSVLSQHALLHTNHARLISAAQDLALQSLTRADSLKLEQDNALKGAIQIQNRAILNLTAQVTKVVTQGQAAKTLLETVAKWQRHPVFRASWVIGGGIGGAIATYLAAVHH